jgi:hypothetical protein
MEFSLVLSKANKFRNFPNIFPKRVTDTNIQEVTEDWRKFRKEKLHNFYNCSSANSDYEG